MNPLVNYNHRRHRVQSISTGSKDDRFTPWAKDGESFDRLKFMDESGFCMELGRGESTEDGARVKTRTCDMIYLHTRGSTLPYHRQVASHTQLPIHKPRSEREAEGLRVTRLLHDTHPAKSRHVHVRIATCTETKHTPYLYCTDMAQASSTQRSIHRK